MRTRVLVSLTVFLLVLACIIGWRVGRLKEPTYLGRRESAWLSDYRTPTDRSVVDEALQAMGTNAVPLLLDYLRTEDSSFRMLLARLGLSYTTAELRHQWAGKGFEALAETASNAVPDLIEIYKRNMSLSARYAAANALVEIGPASRPAVPVLIASATNSDPDVRAFALYTVGRLALEAPLVCQALTNALQDPDRKVRYQAVFGVSSLAFMGGDARSAIPALIEALKDSYPGVRCGAAQALGHIHAETNLVLPALLGALRDQEEIVRAHALSALKEFGTNMANEAVRQVGTNVNGNAGGK